MPKRITILTTFRDCQAAYSLNRVVQDQIKMFLEAGYSPKVVVHQGFEPIEEYKKVECVNIPDVVCHNELYIDKTFAEDVVKLKEALKPILENSDIIISHDLIYQPAAVKHNVAIRELMKENNYPIRFIHWVHSATEPALVQQLRGGGMQYLEICKIPFPNSFYIAFNQFSIPRIAKWFGIEESDVKYVPHPHDFYEFWHPQAIQIAKKGNLLQKDVIILYPVRLDRGKQPEYVIKIAHAVKESGRSVGCVIIDFHSTGGDKVTYRKELQLMALDLGMTESEVFFTSEMNGEDKLIGEFPHQVVSNLFEIANTFILPSKSETYSLIAQEAAVHRNFCILNFDFPPFRSIYGDAAYYLKFSSGIDAMTGFDGETNIKFADEKLYWKDAANYINYVQEHTRVLALANKIRKERNLDFVFRHHIEPLFSVTKDKFNY